MTLVLGLDLSLQATGVCLAGNGQIQVSTITTGTSSGHNRRRTILNTIAGLVTSREPDLVVIENLPPHTGKAGATTLIALAELHGIVKFWLEPRVPYTLVHVAHLKQYALGKGSGPGTSKDQVLLAVERRYGGLVQIFTNDEADALVLAAMALHSYGQPLAPVPATHMAGMRKVRWPDLETPPPDASRDLVPGGVTSQARSFQ
jgi:Holliday junction resolvasome RuvABC endonuclease subunit